MAMSIRKNEETDIKPYIESLSQISGIAPEHIQALDKDTLAMLEMSLSTFIDEADIKDDVVSAVMDSQKKVNLPALSEKMNREYDSYLNELRQGNVENAISNAYQITAKQDILAFIKGGDVRLLPDQYTDLLSSNNALNEVYAELCNGDSNDIRYCLETAANKIEVERTRQQERINRRSTDPKGYESALNKHKELNKPLDCTRSSRGRK